MRCYVVGGAVRDELLGLPTADRDWVVVGAAPEELARAGFRPVGRDFPVFLHPRTGEEYALARTERKSGRGYRGFTIHASPDVSLEEDLRRRDLTINAMARDETGRLIDPFGGERDLRAGILRHVSEAFSEDPVRILRVARFSARFGFRVAGETLALMRSMVASGETDHLVPERFWQEFSRGLSEAHPGKMFEVLASCGFRERHLGDLDSDSNALAARLARAAAARAVLPVRYALLFAGREPRACERAERFSATWRVPGDCTDLASLGCDLAATLAPGKTLSARDALACLRRVDALRRPQRFAEAVSVIELAHPDPDQIRSISNLRQAQAAANSVDAAAIARAAGSPGDIAARIDEAREAAIAAAREDR